MSLRERVILFIEHKNLNKAEFERLVGLSNDAVSKMTDNTRMSTLDKISNAFPELNIAWLKTGEGEMIKSGDVSIKGDSNIANTGIVEGGMYSNSINDKIIELEKEVIRLKGEVARRDETIKGLRNELAIRVEMIEFLQNKK